GSVYRTDFFMQISQTWEQMSLLVQREAEGGGLVIIHSDMASVRVGMTADVCMLRFVYTFEENLPRREGGGTMSRQFSGAAMFEFRREGEAWRVTGHFFDDIGRSGQIKLKRASAEPGAEVEAPAQPAAAANKEPRG